MAMKPEINPGYGSIPPPIPRKKLPPRRRMRPGNPGNPMAASVQPAQAAMAAPTSGRGGAGGAAWPHGNLGKYLHPAKG